MHTRFRGNFTIQLIGLMIISLMFAAVGVDMAYYFAAQNQLQTNADSAALAATDEFYRDIEINPSTKQENAIDAAVELVQANNPDLSLDSGDISFGFIDPISKKYNAASFATPSTNPDYNQTNGYNAIKVTVKRREGSVNNPLPTFFANLLHIDHMDAEASSVALIDQTVNSVTDGGLRPMYVCEAQFSRAMQDGVPSNNVVRIYGDHVEIDGVQNISGCPAMGSGNWGFADLRNCSPDAVGSSTIRDWLATGFPGTVNVGQCYSSSPGNFISSASNELDTLIRNKTTFPLPLYNSWSGNGSNTSVNVSGFVGFKITAYKANGSAASRYIEGRFERYACKKGCTSNNNGTGETTPGGSVVRLRLAAL